MAGFPRKRIEIVVEAPLAREVIGWLGQMGASGHTLLSGVTGSGHQGVKGGHDFSSVLSNVMIIAITRTEVAEAVLAAFHERFTDASAVIWVSDCQVARQDHF